MRGVRHRLIALLLLLLCSCVPAWADLASDLDAVLDGPDFATGWTAAAVLDAETGQWIYERNAGRALLPASTMKVVSGAYALEALGPAHRFRTALCASGGTDRWGVLAGPVYVVGGGDPLTTREQYRELAGQLARRGVTAIRGGLRADVSRFEGRRWSEGWSIDDLALGYGALPDALCLDGQRVSFRVRPTRAGEAPSVETGLPPDALALDNRARTAAAESPTTIAIDRDPLGSRYVVTGEIAEGATPLEGDLALADPPLAVLAVVRAELRARGIRCGDGGGHAAAPPGAVELAAVQSRPLGEILTHTLKTSDNLAAEMLLWDAAVEEGAGRTRQQALLALGRWLEGEQLPTTGIRVRDGSGLSRYDALTPRFLVGLLAKMLRSRHTTVFVEALPVSGVDGTLEGRFTLPPLKGNVHAKTGSMSRVSTLAGYLTTGSGRTLVFAFLWNGHTCAPEQVYDAQGSLLTRLYAWSPEPTP
jgi:serine-type D-Ala-D-Ala carboxypeptidase/endopeptidase (penicillin-binding protein 4)